jgi:predicted small secreted protein
MKVRLINYTKDPEKIVAQSARLCYSALGIEELREKLSDESIIKLVKKIMSYRRNIQGYFSSISETSACLFFPTKPKIC